MYKTHHLKDKTFEVAIKVLNKNKLSDTIDQMMEEIEILTMLDHPNIANHLETYDDKDFVYIGK